MSDTEKKHAQVSLTEWLERMGYAETTAFREEDNAKRDRLQHLNARIGLPTDLVSRFSAQEVADRAPRFMETVASYGDRLCALRLVPHDPAMPKLRIWNVPTADALAWFAAQTIDNAAYRVELMPRPSEHRWSTIIVVNEDGVFGDIIADSHDRLTQGFEASARPITFQYDFTTWRMSEKHDGAREHLKELVALLHVPDAAMRDALRTECNATFAHDHLCGYFETVCSQEFGIWFIDYNRILGGMLRGTRPHVATADAALHGQTSCAGSATGRVRIVTADTLAEATIPGGDVLVMDMTTPDALPLMQRASAIVTERGGLLSHAAIVSRELKKPCIVGVRGALAALHNGDLVRVDAENGVVERLP
ncbi:hypothetical protein HYS28_03045 [Candidatus Uhrbacteria bacterium]|nr:hypothetical protein [Candidatus Uhrbacteria bacterium]